MSLVSIEVAAEALNFLKRIRKKYAYVILRLWQGRTIIQNGDGLMHQAYTSKYGSSKA